MAEKVEKLDAEIEHVLSKMASLEPGTEQYGMAAVQLNTLYETRSLLKSKPINLDVVFTAVAATAQIIGIMGYERFNVFSTKALGFITKGRY